MSPRPIPKLVAPHARRVVSRKRVAEAIKRALGGGVCWIAAPAGYGKTTAVADHLHHRRASHLWYRVDEGDQDIASFFHYLAQALRCGRPVTPDLPVFGPEYADQSREFSRRFFRAWFAALPDDSLLVLDDLHYADVPRFREILAVLLGELPDHLRCICVSRTLPPPELDELRFKERMTILDQTVLRFSDREARAMIAARAGRGAPRIDPAAAGGWAAGLVLLAERATEDPASQPGDLSPNKMERATVFAGLARQLFDGLDPAEQLTLLQVSVLPEITPHLACQLAGSSEAAALLERLHQRQLLVTRGDNSRTVYRLHDLLRDFLRERLVEQFPAGELARLRQSAAELTHEAGQVDLAIELAVQAGAWPLARRLMLERAESLLAEGRRATLIEWSGRLPPAELDGWLCYWLGVAHMADDATAEDWLARAWDLFIDGGDLGGQCLAAARAVLAKTDSWRTHEGLTLWTGRVLELIDRDLPLLRGDDQLLAWAGILRAVDFAPDYQSESQAVRRLTLRLLARLAMRGTDDTPTMRLVASLALMEHAGSSGQAEVFERAVDSVIEDLRNTQVTPWVRGMWLVAFGAVSGCYFSYTRRGFPYASAEDALREAVALGEGEGLKGVEFGALYHLQLQMKLRNDFSEFTALIDRIAQVADSRYTTQVAVVADCQAALYTMQRRFPEAHAACERFNAAIEAANEPPIERWPHYITQFQVLLADGRPREAAALLESVLPHFDGGMRRRTVACISAARALDARWNGAADYPQRLGELLRELREANWLAILINLPAMAAELCADALDAGIEPAFCATLIGRRVLTPPPHRPRNWPWALRIQVLGGFHLQGVDTLAGAGGKTATRSLDILRVLAIAREHTCSLEDLQEWLWPDADGDQARAACEQALHRLRKLLGRAELLVLREGKLRLAMDRVWVDLADWEGRLRAGLRNPASSQDELERVFNDFSGPLLHQERVAHWSLAAADRVRGAYVDLARRVAGRHEAAGDAAKAYSVWQQALESYPASEPCFEALIRLRLVQADRSGALEDFRRCERALHAELGTKPSAAIRALVAPLLGSAAP